MTAPPDPSPTPDPQRAWAYRPASPLRGAPDGPLAGLTFSVKDLFSVPGWPLGASTRAPVPEVGESVLVQRLLALGATAMGKTHLHEVALGITGLNGYEGTEHPFLPGHAPGGSSSGAAVTVALGQVDVALGTDTGGSIRVPAAWCGVVGYKPTKGYPAWSTQGVLPLSPTCDHAGPLARDMATVVRVHEALTGEAVPMQDWTGVRVGLWLPEGWVTPEVRAAVEAFASALEARGAALSAVEVPEMLDAYTPIVLSEAAEVHREALRLAEPGFLPFTLDSLRQGAALGTEEVAAAHARREVYRAEVDALFQTFDVLLAPAVPTPPPPLGTDEVDLPGGRVPLRRAVLRLTVPFSLLGLPSVALPTTEPWVGVQLVGRWREDDRLLGLARSLTADGGCPTAPLQCPP